MVLEAPGCSRDSVILLPGRKYRDRYIQHSDSSDGTAASDSSCNLADPGPQAVKEYIKNKFQILQKCNGSYTGKIGVTAVFADFCLTYGDE